jgi:3-dehydroquinate synthase
MRAAMYLGESTGYLSAEDSVAILGLLDLYGPIPPLDGIRAENLLARLVHDKKTVRGAVHFVVPVRIGEAAVASGVDDGLVMDAIRGALA